MSFVAPVVYAAVGATLAWFGWKKLKETLSPGNAPAKVETRLVQAGLYALNIEVSNAALGPIVTTQVPATGNPSGQQILAGQFEVAKVSILAAIKVMGFVPSSPLELRGTDLMPDGNINPTGKSFWVCVAQWGGENNAPVPAAVSPIKTLSPSLVPAATGTVANATAVNLEPGRVYGLNITLNHAALGPLFNTNPFDAALSGPLPDINDAAGGQILIARASVLAALQSMKWQVQGPVEPTERSIGGDRSTWQTVAVWGGAAGTPPPVLSPLEKVDATATGAKIA